MSNSILTIDMITRKALEILENNLVITRNVNRQYDDSFAVEGAKIGSTLRIRLPDRALVTDGAALQVQDDNEQYTTLSVASQKHIGVNFTSAELTMQLDDFAERVLKQIKKQIKNTSIIAPFSGVVTKKMIDLGSVVGPGTPALELTDISSLKLNISVPERDILKFKIGQQVTVNADVYANKPFSGRVSNISVKADASHNFKVEVLIQNTSANPLMAGMYGSVVLQNSKTINALSIPRKALLGSSKAPQVFVVKNGKAKIVSFTAGTSDGEFIEVIDGLSKNDIIVIKGQINIQNNSNVITK